MLLLVWIDSVRTTQTVFLGMGFAAIAIIFATHGLSTPGFIVEPAGFPYAVVISAGLSQLIGATFILLSVLPPGLPGVRARVEVSVWLIPAMLALLAGYFGVAMLAPERLAFIPTDDWWNALVAVGTLAMLGWATWRYWRAWRLTSFAGQLATVLALVLLMETQLSMHLGRLWQVSWWLYHGLMLAAFLALLGGWALEARRARSLLLFPRSLALRDGISRVHVARPETLEALEMAVATKDGYTRHHMSRVADFAVAMGHRLRLDEPTVRRLETAGRIHDVGKIAIPDAVLLKPGKLTEHEFEQIKHHAERGARIAAASEALRDLAPIVRAHHERFAGGGYPDGLAGDAIPIEARIISVADVFDALTSPRVYRGSRPFDEALAELERSAGTQLDPDVVRLFVRWYAIARWANDQRMAA